MRNGERALLAILNLYVQIKIPVEAFDTNHSDTDITQSIAALIQKLPDSVVKSVSRARHTQSLCQEKTIRLSISLGIAAGFFYM
jgi:hypothetical protein